MPRTSPELDNSGMRDGDGGRAGHAARLVDMDWVRTGSGRQAIFPNSNGVIFIVLGRPGTVNNAC
jgi:hypothetical protein